MIWFIFIIPAIAVPIFRFLFPHKLVWWELLLMLAPGIIIIPICHFAGKKYAAADYERWGNYGVRGEYHEFWDEEVSCRHPIYEDVPTGTDSDGNTTYTSVYVGDEHAYDVDDHYAFWRIQDNAGTWHRIKQPKFGELARDWDGKTFKDMRRRNVHSRDGDMYFTTFTNDDEVMKFIFTDHVYENRVQVNMGVYAYEKIADHDHLYQYERVENMFNDPAILHSKSNVSIGKADHKLQLFNAKRGRDLQVRVWVLLFQDSARRVGFEQEAHWIGANKNELVITVGTDSDGAVMWCHPFCWSPDGYSGNDTLRIQIRDFVEKQDKLDMSATVDYIMAETPGLWQRKQFEELSFLHIPAPWWATLLAFILTLLSTGGVITYAVLNDINETNSRWNKRRSYKSL